MRPPLTFYERMRRRELVVAYALLTPAVVLVAVVLAYPLRWEVWASFSELSTRVPGRRLVGLVNYQAMVAEPFFWRALATTIGYLLVTTVAKLMLGLAMALLLLRPARWRGV